MSRVCLLSYAVGFVIASASQVALGDAGIGDTDEQLQSVLESRVGVTASVAPLNDSPFTATLGTAVFDQTVTRTQIGPATPPDVAEGESDFRVRRIPEPASVVLLGIGVVCVLSDWRRTRRAV